MSKYLTLCGLLLVLASCRNEMHDQPKMKPYRTSAMFADSLSMRPLPAGTVARGYLRDDSLFESGATMVSGKKSDATEFPTPVTAAMIDRGEDRFNIYCTPCHGIAGDGDGMVVQRGFRPPPSFHSDRLIQAAPGHFFDVMTNGFGVMPEYAMQLSPADRWAVASYIRVLQTTRQPTGTVTTASAAMHPTSQYPH